MVAVVFVGGASGVGKTTVCEELKRLNRINGTPAYLRFFKCIDSLSGALPPTAKLRCWEELQHALVKRVILPLAGKGRSILFDTHYSFQRDGGPIVAFAKRGFVGEIRADATHSKTFVDALVKHDLPLGFVLLEADTAEILRHQRVDHRVDHAMLAENIQYEQTAELEHWKQLCRYCTGMKYRVIVERVGNMGHPTLAAEVIVRVANLLDL